jgi:uncharacterized membrane-anchored protein
MKHPLLSLLTLAILLPAAPAQEARPELPPAIRQLLDGLKYQTGEVTLKDGLAKITLPETFRFLGPDDANQVLTKLWGNPPGARPLGMLVPTSANLASGEAWAVIVTFEEDGYVKDDDAAKIDYNDLLKQMKEGTAAANEERLKNGYPAIELVGWAAPPRYDAATKKMYWAKDLKFGAEDAHTLNYGIRILGRRGVLVLNAVASMEQLPEIEAATPAILGMVEFQPGHRYADFNQSTDQVAKYGLAGLVAGGILAKTGMFAKLGLIFAKFAKVIFVVGALLVAAITKLFKGRKAESVAGS